LLLIFVLAVLGVAISLILAPPGPADNFGSDSSSAFCCALSEVFNPVWVENISVFVAVRPDAVTPEGVMVVVFFSWVEVAAFFFLQLLMIIKTAF
jgi:hypothetical protein